MRFVIPILLIVTPLCVWVGYRVGSQMAKEPVVDAILANTEIKQISKDEYVLNFACRGETLVTFDVDSDKVISEKLSDDRVDKIWSKAVHAGTYQRVYDTVFGFATGGGAIKYAKPVLTLLKAKENSKYTIPALVGGLSGFYLGYELAVRRAFNCDDLVVLDFARSEEVWKEVLKWEIARRYLLEEIGPYAGTGQFADWKNSNELKEIRQELEDGKVNSVTFAKLEALAVYVQPKQSSDGWFTIDLIVGLWFPVGMLMVGAVVLGFILSESAIKRVRSRRKRQDAPSNREA